MRDDGSALPPALPKQDAFLAEAGYHVWNHRLTPFGQYQARHFASTALPGQNEIQAGVAWRLAGHQRILTFSAVRPHTGGLPDRTQVLNGGVGTNYAHYKIEFHNCHVRN